MALLNLRKSCVNLLKTKYDIVGKRNFNITSSSLSLNERVSRVASYKMKEKRLVERDRVPPNYELIYNAPMRSYVTWAMHISTVTASLIGVAALYQLALNEPLLDPVDTKLVIHSDDIYYFAAGFVAINAALRLVVSKFPLRIYKNQNKYLAVFHSQLPSLISQHHFERGQVKDVNYFFNPWNNITYKLGDKTSLLFDDYFKTPSEFHEMRNDKENKY